MSANFTDVRLEFEFTSTVWTDVSEDIEGGVVVSSGIRGNGPLDKIASTGLMRFTLINSGNEYTPTNVHCVSGFEKGVSCRLRVEYDGIIRTKFFGRVSKIEVVPGDGLDYYTTVTVVDYMDILARHELQLPEYATSQNMSRVMRLIVANMDIKPLATGYAEGQDTFDAVFDTTKGGARALQELSKVTLSELGHIYVSPASAADEFVIEVSGAGTSAVNDTYGYYGDWDGKVEYYTSDGAYSIIWTSSPSRWNIFDTSTWESLYYSTDDVANPVLVTTWVAGTGSAPVPTLAWTDSDEVLISYGRYGRNDLVSSASLDDEDVTSVGVSYGEDNYNEIKTIVYPRTIDATATNVLFTLNRYIAIGPGETKKVTGRFIDPNQEAQSVTGTEMVTPVATTDYLFNTASDGSGSDITADLGIIATYGTNGVEYALTNNNAGTGYVTHLQARGKGIYIYRPVEYSEEYDTGITADGRITLNLRMPYQSNPLIGEDFASVLLDLYKTKRLRVDTITFDANKDAAMIAHFRDLCTGHRITLDLVDLGITGDFFIQGMTFVITQNGATRCMYRLISEAMLPAADYWELDSATLSQLGETTKLGF